MIGEAILVTAWVAATITLAVVAGLVIDQVRAFGALIGVLAVFMLVYGAMLITSHDWSGCAPG